MGRTPLELIARESRLGARNYEPLEIVLARGEGVWVWDVDGVRYLDCLSAYSAVNQGHCHPKIVEAMVEQARRLTIASRAFYTDQLALLYEDIAELFGAGERRRILRETSARPRSDARRRASSGSRRRQRLL